MWVRGTISCITADGYSRRSHLRPPGQSARQPPRRCPRRLGGTRNWDYRYAWVRDASFTIQALWVAACPDEANQFFDYVTNSAAGSLDRGDELQIMFGIGGERDLTERELPHLEGWRHSVPVRVGNGAWSQRQLDVYGELLGAVYRLSDHLFDHAHRQVGPMADPDKWGAPPDLAPATRRFFVQLADTAARRWQEKDQGIWEVRGEPRHFVYSKLMCWVALDRAVALADRLDATDRVEPWRHTQDLIREAILTRGWSDRANAFTQSFGSDDLDASNLMLSLVGFLPADEPRVLSTINATEERLTDARGLVYRYRSHDGLEGEEGTFLLCTFWLAQALARAGHTTRARTVFERAADFVNDVGLLSEEVDPVSGDLLGNFPQAFSHIGLVNAAWAISESELREKTLAKDAPRTSGGCRIDRLNHRSDSADEGHASTLLQMLARTRSFSSGSIGTSNQLPPRPSASWQRGLLGKRVQTSRTTGPSYSVSIMEFESDL